MKSERNFTRMDDECADDSAVELPAYFLGPSLQRIKKLRHNDICTLHYCSHTKNLYKTRLRHTKDLNKKKEKLVKIPSLGPKTPPRWQTARIFISNVNFS